jgi:hypothetical protein
MEADYVYDKQPLNESVGKIFVPSAKVIDEDSFVKIAMESARDIPGHVYDFQIEDLLKAYNIGVDLYNTFLNDVDDELEEVNLTNQIRAEIEKIESSEVTIPLTKTLSDRGYFPSFAFGLVSVSLDVKNKSRVIPVLSDFKDKIATQAKILKKVMPDSNTLDRGWREAYDGRRNNMQPYTIPGCTFPDNWAVSFRNKAYHIIENSNVDPSMISTVKTEAESISITDSKNVSNNTLANKSNLVNGLLDSSSIKSEKIDSSIPIKKDQITESAQSTIIQFKSSDWTNGKTVVWPYMLADNMFVEDDSNAKSRDDRFRLLAIIYNLNNLSAKSISLTDLVSTPVNNKIYPNGVKVPGDVKWDQKRYKDRQAKYLKDPNFIQNMKIAWKKYIIDIRKSVVT